MSSPSESPATDTSKDDPSNRTLDDSADGAWGAETDFDNLEKEASKIFALWEFVPGASAPDAAAPSDAAVPEAAVAATVAAAPVAEPAEVWAPADTEVLPNAAQSEDAASTLRDIAAQKIPAADVVVAPPAAQPVAAQPIAFTAPASVIVEALPDLPAVAPVRAVSSAPVAQPQAPVAVRPANVRPVQVVEEAPTLPSSPNYVLLAAAAVIVLAVAGGAVGYSMTGSTPEPSPTTPVATSPAPVAPAVAAAPPAPIAPPIVAAAPVAPPAPVAVVAPVVEPAPAAVVPPVAPVVAPPPPETHRLRVRVTPTDATLALDGVQVVNPLDREITEGTHQLTATREGFEPSSETVDLSRSREVTMRLRAVPAPVVATAPAAPRTPRSSAARPPTPRTTTPRTTAPRTPRTTTPSSSGRGTFVTESPY